jgi:F0F1-type ATP synthase assembly protein I
MAPSPGDEKESKNPLRTNIAGVLHEFGPFLTLGFQLAAAVAVFLLIGIWLDDRFSTSPLWTLVGLAIGVTGGFIKFFRAVSEMEKNHNHEDPSSHA